MNLRRSLGLVITTLAVAACSQAPSRLQEATPQLPVLFASAPVPVAPPSSTAEAEAPAPSPVNLFFPALTSPDWLNLHRLSNAIVAVRHWDGYQFAVAEGDDFVHRQELSYGLPEGMQGSIKKLIGRYPDALWLIFGHADRGGLVDRFFDLVYRFDRTQWKLVHRSPADETYVWTWEAPEGCLLGLRSNGMPEGGHHTSKALVRVIDCKGKTPALPGLQRGPDKGLGRFIHAAEGLRSGDLYLLDAEDLRAPGRPPMASPILLEIWPAGSPTSSISQVPSAPEVMGGGSGPALGAPRLFARGTKELYAVMNIIDDEPARAPGAPAIPPWIVRFDGASWSPIERPPVAVYTELVLGDDGAFLLRGGKGSGHEDEPEELWRRRPGEGWSSLGRLPLDGTGKAPLPKQITGRAGDDIWVFGWGAQGGTVFHTRPPASVTNL